MRARISGAPTPDNLDFLRYSEPVIATIRSPLGATGALPVGTPCVIVKDCVPMLIDPTLDVPVELADTV